MCKRPGKKYFNEELKKPEDTKHELSFLCEKLGEEKRVRTEKSAYAFQNGSHCSELLKHCEKNGIFVLKMNEAASDTKI